MILECKTFLVERAKQWNLPEAGEWNVFVHNNYHPHCSNLNLLWFRDNQPFPQVVTKVFREPRLPSREFENLQRAYACTPGCVPKPLHFGAQGQFWMLWMNGVPGSPVLTGSRRSLSTLRPVVDMLASMHRAVSAAPGISDPGRYRRVVTDPLRTLADYGASSSVRAGCASLEASVPAKWIHSLPMVPQHGDLFASNILSQHNRWYLVDWESFGTIDLPFYDLLTLLISMLLDSGKTPAEWDSVLVQHTPELLRRYAEHLRLSVADISVLLPLTLANWFHLQWTDGREEFSKRMYGTIQNYFEHRTMWEKVFVSRVDECLPQP